MGLDSDQDIKVIPKPVLPKLSLDKKPESSLPFQTLSIEYIPSGSGSLISNLYLKYWLQYGITQSVLDHFDVRQVSYLSYVSNSGRSLCFKYESRNQIVSAYHISGRVKVYIPEISPSFSDDPNFKGQKKSFSYKNQTKEDVFGLSQLPEETLEYILFLAGEKDTMSSYSQGFINVISLQSENQMPSDDLLKSLRTRTSVLLSCYDNDQAGKNSSKKLSDSYGIVSISLPEEVKDISDYFQKYNSANFQFLLDEGIRKSKSISIKPVTSAKVEKTVNTKRGRIESYLDSKFNFRFNVFTKECQINIKGSSMWEKVNVDEL
ncbi:toprim domain-containing protein, partial [Candidatus Cardinium hertigii]|uniref:toprim domain-containing protein n=1 Tax=Candidatus Cardinium hertigii TaxID=247481 RepID=UPI003D7C95C7